jgi:hypothetical protein
MSVHWTSYVWDFGPQHLINRYVLLKLADNADHNGECYPSIPEICRRTCASVSTVKRAIRALTEQGWIEVLETGLGRGHASRYRLRKPDEKKVSDRPLSTVAQKGSDRTGSDRTGSVGTIKGVCGTNPPDPLIGRTVIEPNTTTTPLPPKGGNSYQRRTRRQHGASVGVWVDDGFRMPVAYPGDPRAQRVHDALTADALTAAKVSLADMAYFNELQRLLHEDYRAGARAQ